MPWLKSQFYFIKSYPIAKSHSCKSNQSQFAIELVGLANLADWALVLLADKQADSEIFASSLLLLVNWYKSYFG